MSQGSITMIISSATVGPNKSSKIASWLGKRWQQASSVFSTGGQHTSHTSHPHIQINSLPPRQQINSLLLNTLPLEIQRQIYYYVVSSYGNTQHILLSDDHHGQLTHMRCVLPTSHSYFQDHLVRITGVCIPDGAHNNEYRKSAQNGWEILPLLLSCRKIYLELSEILYSSTTFRFSSNYAITKFIATVPAHYITLSHLHLSLLLTTPLYLPYDARPYGFTDSDVQAAEAEWEASWHALARRRVCALVVEILDMGIRVPEQRLLQPLKNVARTGNGPVEVVLPWPRGLKTSDESEDVIGLVVTRPPEDIGSDLMMEWSVDKACESFTQTRDGVVRRWFRTRRS